MAAIKGRGHPTYNNKTCSKVLEYIKNYADHGDVIPSVVGLAAYLEVARNTIYFWARDEEKKEFAELLDVLNAKQEQVLLNNGLNGSFNSNICKLVMGKHGYHDKQETTDTDGNTVAPVMVVIGRVDASKNNPDNGE